MSHPHHTQNLNKEKGFHYCGIYSTDEKRVEATVEFVVEGLKQNDKIYVIEDDPENHTSIQIILQQRGVNLAQEMSRKAVNFTTAADTYLSGGYFSLDKMFKMLLHFSEEACQEGYSKMRITAEPCWVFCIEKAPLDFLEFERGINHFFNSNNCIGLCAYSMEKWSRRFLLDVLTSHPAASINGEIFDNCYYIPPDEAQDIHSATLERWMNQLKERRGFEVAIKMASEKAIKTDRARSHFLATMSHEMRTPLNGIIGIADILAETKLNEDQRQSIKIIISSGNHLLSVINDVLDMATIESGKMKLENKAIVLSELLKNAWNICSSNAKKKNVTIETKIHPNVPEFIMGDFTRLSQVLFNVLGNAIKFSYANSKVCLSITATEHPLDQCVKENMCFVDRSHSEFFILSFSVRDEGIGISEEKKHDIFDTFTQGDVSITRKFGGTGLGLPISRNICQKWGGDISVKSELGKYSEFVFDLPTSFPSKVFKNDLLTKGESMIYEKGKPCLGNIKVLVAEDNHVNQLIMEKMLCSLGCNVTFADNGLAAADAVKRETFNVIFMDIHMPVCDGFQSAQLIRNYLKDSTPPIIALTASCLTFQHEKDKFKKLMDGFILKPARLNTFRELISGLGENIIKA